MRPRARIWVIVAVASAASAAWWSLRTSPEAAPQTAERPPPEAHAGALDREQIVRHVYERFRRYTGAEPEDRVEIALDDFRHVERADFDSVALYPDLAALGSDWVLVATPHVTQRDDGSAHVRYQAEWRPAENLVRRAETAAFLGTSAEEMTAIAAGRLAGERRRTTALTSYRVSVELDGRRASYRAAFRWFRDADGALHFAIVDAVVYGLALALVETVAAPGGEGGFDDARRAAPLLESAAADSAPVCVAQAWPATVTEPAEHEDDSGHLFGGHSSMFAAQIECSCDTACVSRCEPSVVAARCEETGRLEEADRVHRVQGRAAAAATRRDRGDEKAASCLASLECYAERCLGAECGSVEVTPQAAAPGARFSLSIDLVSSHSSAHDHACGRCTAR